MLVFCDEMIAGVKRHEWSEADCRMFGVSVGGDEILDLAATINGSNGEQFLRNFMSTMFPSNFPQTDINRIIENSLKTPNKAAAELLLSVMQSDIRDIVGLIRRPTFCIGGKQSHLGSEVMPWIASNIVNAKVVMIEARHFVNLEKPVEFNTAVSNFLSEWNQ